MRPTAPLNCSLESLSKIGEGPAYIERRPVQAKKGIKAGVVAPCRGNAEQVKRVGKAFRIPAELHLKVHIAQAAAFGLRRGRTPGSQYTGLIIDEASGDGN